MRAFIFFTLLLILHAVLATHPIDKITEKVHAGLKTLKQKAAHKLHKLSEEIDLKKLHELDVLKLFHHPPKHVHVHEHYKKKPLVIDPYQVDRLKHYFEPHHKPAPAPVHFHHVGHIHH